MIVYMSSVLVILMDFTLPVECSREFICNFAFCPYFHPLISNCHYLLSPLCTGGQCYDGHRVFEGDSADKILCHEWGRWFFTDEICTLGTVISWDTEGDALSPSVWLKNAGGSSWAYSFDILVSDCGNNAAFTGLDCLENNIYEEEICVTTNSSLWNSARTFTIDIEQCANDQPIYHYVVYNESNWIKIGGEVVGNAVEATYYVHYQPDYRFSTDTEKTGQWMLTKDEVSVNYLAFCWQEDLMACTGGNWEIQYQQFAEGDGLDGIILNILDPHMTVSDGSCGAQTTGWVPRTGWVVSFWVWVILVVILVVCIVCLCAWCMWRRMTRNEASSGKHEFSGAEPEVEMAEETEAELVESGPTKIGAEGAGTNAEVEVTMENQGQHQVSHTAM